MRLIIRQRQSYFLSQWKVCINAYLLFHFSYFAQAIAHISTENSIFASSFQLNKLFYFMVNKNLYTLLVCLLLADAI